MACRDASRSYVNSPICAAFEVVAPWADRRPPLP